MAIWAKNLLDIGPTLGEAETARKVVWDSSSGHYGEKSESKRAQGAHIGVSVTKAAATTTTKAAALKPALTMAKRNAAMVAAAAKGEKPKALAKRMKMSHPRVYQILRDAKRGAAPKKAKAKVTAIVPVSPVGRAQNLLLRVAVLKEAVRNALNSPAARFTPKLGDEILGALASARMAELAVKEASVRLDNVRHRLQAGVIPGKLNGAALRLKALAKATRIGQPMKSVKA